MCYIQVERVIAPYRVTNQEVQTLCAQGWFKLILDVDIAHIQAGFFPVIWEHNGIGKIVHKQGKSLFTLTCRKL